jgi:hypothetical protein
MPTKYVSTWMYIESPDEAGVYPQVGGPVTSQAVQDIYWRCVFTLFWSASYFIENKDGVKLLLFTNVSRLPTVDGLDLNVALSAFGVEIVTLRYTWTPSGKRRVWFNQYFLFDILEYFSVRLNDDDAVLIMDNDCLIVRDVAFVFDRLYRDNVLLMTVDVAEDEEANGLSRRQAIEIYERIGGQRPEHAPAYFGGEFYGLTAAALQSVVVLAKEARTQNNALAAAGATYLSDEAHLFSFIMWTLGFREPNANDIARRIWTTWKRNNTRPEDLRLPIWHVPSEKTYGFPEIFSGLIRRPFSIADRVWTQKWLARKLGVGRKSVRKFFGHIARALRRRLHGRM